MTSQDIMSVMGQMLQLIFTWPKCLIIAAELLLLVLAA
jgi:hypothetical protein